MGRHRLAAAVSALLLAGGADGRRHRAAAAPAAETAALLEAASSSSRTAFPVHPAVIGAAALPSARDGMTLPTVPGPPRAPAGLGTPRASEVGPLRASTFGQELMSRLRFGKKATAVEDRGSVSSREPPPMPDEPPILPGRPEVVTKAYPVMARRGSSASVNWVPTGREQSVDVPQKWARGFASAYVTKDDGDGLIYSGRAKLTADSAAEVAFRAAPAAAIETRRDLHMAKMLSPTGSVPALFDSVTTDEGVTYMLKESEGSLTLDGWLSPYEVHSAGLAPRVRLEESLPVMVDLLRGLRDMADRGIIHGDVSGKHIYLVGEDRRAVIGDFGHASSLRDSQYTDASINIRRSASAFRQAPETMEIPTQLSNNVWQLGLTFARLLFGEEAVPTPATAALWVEDPMFLDDESFEGRRFIQRTIREKYSLAAAPAFRELSDEEYGGLKRLVLGMLEQDPAKRLTADDALIAAEAFAKEAGVALPAPRRPAEQLRADGGLESFLLGLKDDPAVGGSSPKSRLRP